ncbi:hypothetical protein EKL97_10420 [Flavobacterium sp. LS1P28]|uniref:hypothetical protein n=1 Tax=Flavobacterium sp. LS1P28 TaxID=2497752 RepID=UPI000F827F8F|nr:hypothetical protein [Flavobacterium sp. LS1P28]RTY80670.1 hypothetical protein EKL97_10420 [Flavobacterium sp. LS1P28]
MADKNTIKNWFRTNLKPTQEQFWATWDSYFHKDEKIPITAIDDIEAILADKADAEALTNHKNDAVAHAELFLGKEDKTEKGAINGYAPLNEVAKIASQYLSIVNDLITGGANDLLAAEQGVVLQTQIDEINVLLASNDVNLDNVQELVDAIKTVQTSLETILVNDFTTGGTTKAATAETVKILKVLVDEKLSGASLKTINGISLIGPGENIVIPVRLKEVVVQNKSQLLGNLSSDVLYLIDGSFSLTAGETIVVPVGGLNIMGYSFDASRIASYGVANHTIFTSPAGGSGNLIIHNIAFNATGTGAKVFDIIDVDGTHAVEMVTVNFEGCKSIGKLKNYRQGTGITIGFYGCADGLMLSGTWTGFKLTNTNCFGFGATGTLFKKDVDTYFSNRLYLEINADFQTGCKLADFEASNFSLNELFQINASILKYNGTINDANATAVIPNIKANDVKCLWRSNVGLPDTALEKYVENSAVTGAYVINWLVDTYYLTLTGNTTFTESNLPASGKNTEELKIYLAGNFTPTFPAAWEVNKVGTFKKGEMNQITLKFIKTGVYFMKIDNSLTVYPAPDVSGVFPNSILPDATSALTVYGSFFTPATIVSIASHMVNSVTFINDGELLLSVTAANLEGDFALTISNGTTVIYQNRVSVYLGAVFVPKLVDWTVIYGTPNIETDGAVKITVFDSEALTQWRTKIIPSNINWSIRFNYRISPLGTSNWTDRRRNIGLKKVSNNQSVFEFQMQSEGASSNTVTGSPVIHTFDINNVRTGIGLPNSLASTSYLKWESYNIDIRYISGVLYIYVNGSLMQTLNYLIDSQMYLDVSVIRFNIENIKFIELA